MFKSLFGKKAEPEHVTVTVAVLCKFWFEDGVWNAAAADLPVAVFGDTFENAKEHLGQALATHFEALEKVGGLEEAVRHLQQRAREQYFSVAEMPLDRPLVKMEATVHDRRVVAVG